MVHIPPSGDGSTDQVGLKPDATIINAEPRSSPVDGDALLADFGQNRTLLAEVIGVFVSDAPKFIATLRAAAQTRSADSVESAAHALKGSVGLFTTGGAYEAARRLEHAARAGDLSAVEVRCAEIERELSRVCADLEALRSRLL